MSSLVIIGAGFGAGYALANFFRRTMPLSIGEVLFGGVFGIPANADEAADAIHWEAGE